jgi:hypothetical protein
LRIRVSDVPALFSEGTEPEAREDTPWWGKPAKLRVRLSWPPMVSRLSARSKAIFQA